MTPAQLTSLLTVHARVHDPEQAKRTANRGTSTDLMAFARMRAG